MYTRYATKITAISISILAVTIFFTLAVQSQSQDPAPDKPQEKQGAAAATQTPSPAPKTQQKMGTELDDRNGPIITNTDLITLTVTATDTYGRYVSGLSKGAFAVFDNKQQQEITYFSDDDSPVSVGVIFDVS